MKFDKINRRVHLYLALALMPWFVMYGVSALPFNHHDTFQAWFEPEGGMWTERFDTAYSVEVPQNASDEELRAIGKQLMDAHGLYGAFGVYRAGANQLNVYIYTFLHSIQLNYHIDEERLVAKDRKFRFDHFLTGMHARGGYHQDSVLDDIWAILVDIVCLSIIIWIASGLYMWWKLKATRLWGSVALVGGWITLFLFFWLL